MRWKKATGAKGYELQYSTSKKFSKKTTKSRQVKTTKLVLKKMKKKTYYVRVRAFKKVNGKKQYSVWSKTKKIK